MVPLMPAPETSRPTVADPRSQAVWSLIRLVGAMVLLALAIRQVMSFGHALPSWSTLDAGWLAASLAVAAVSVFGWWVRWLLFLRLAGVPAAAGETLRLTWMADFFNYFIFGALAADGFRMAMLSRRFPQKKAAVAASIAFDHMAGLLSSAVFFAAFTVPHSGWIIERGGPAMSGFLWTSGIALGALALLTFSGVMATKVHKNWVAWATRRWPAVSGAAVKMLDQLRELRARACLANLGLLASMVCLAASYAAFAAAARAWGSPIPWFHFFAVLPVVDALSALPVTVQGLGIREQIFLAVFPSGAGNDHAQILAVSLTGFAVQSLWALLGGALIAWDSLPAFARRTSRSKITP